MSIPLKAAVLTALLAAALISRSFDWVTVGVLAFGSFNALVSLPGTRLVRGAAIVSSLVVILSAGHLRAIAVLLCWLVWPPAFLVAWALARVDATPDEERPERSATRIQPRVAMAAIVAAVAMAALDFRLLIGYGLQQTAAVFVGIPAVLAIVVIFTVSPHSATGVACKAVTVGLLISLMFLGEGILCVLMSAPLFYLVAISAGVVVDRTRRGSRQDPYSTFSCLALVALIPMSLEGVTGVTSLNRDEAVATTRIVYASPEAVERALFASPRFDRALPLYLRAGFPRPISTRIEQSATGTRWVIRLRGGEMRLNGMEPRAGDLVLSLDEARPGLLRWRAVADDSHMTHFLRWQEATVQWEPVGAHATKVTWTLRYRRGLDPAWYFGPWERYAARLAAGYLIDSVATP